MGNQKNQKNPKHRKKAQSTKKSSIGIDFKNPNAAF